MYIVETQSTLMFDADSGHLASDINMSTALYLKELWRWKERSHQEKTKLLLVIIYINWCFGNILYDIHTDKSEWPELFESNLNHHQIIQVKCGHK